MSETYIIGEIGQNHNGSADIAKLIAELASKKPEDTLFGYDLKPMNAIKLTKRDLNQELTNSAMNAPYNSKNSFGKTYGEHRAFLELSNEEHYEVYKYVKSIGLDFVETLCAIGCLDLLKLFEPDKLKVASRDLTNLPLLEAMAETKIPMIISTGMAGEKELDNALNVISKKNSDITILHCLSEYPSKNENINLKTINFLQKKYDNYTIGYSDHSIGIMIPVAAVALGAKVIEKHITINRNMKGTDQIGSLGPEGIERMVRDIRLLELSFGEESIFASKSVATAKVKLERSIASKNKIEKGKEIKESDIHLLSPGDGFKWNEKNNVIGKVALNDILPNEIIYSKLIK